MRWIVLVTNYNNKYDEGMGIKTATEVYIQLVVLDKRLENYHLEDKKALKRIIQE